MDWYRMYTSFSEDEKWEHTHDSVVPHLQGLYIAGCSWAATNESDGRLPRKVARFAPYWMRAALDEHVALQDWSLDDLANELCLLKLWEPEGEGGFQICGWLKRNISKASLDVRRNAARKGGKRSAEKRRHSASFEALASSGASTELRVKELRVKDIKNSSSSLSSSANSTTKQVFEYWRSELKPRAKFDAKRRARIAARLKEGFTVEQLKTVVEKAKASPHHSGKNDRGRTYQDIHTIFRDAAQVEAFLDGHHDKPTMKANGDEAEYQAKLARIKKHFT